MKRCLRVHVVCVVLFAVAGCAFLFPPEPGPKVFTEDNPGIWDEVMPQKPEVTFRGLKMTIKVRYKERTTDYVERVRLVDDQGREFENLLFGFGKPVEFTENLPTGTQSVKIIVQSSKPERGEWHSNRITVPPPKTK